MSNPALAGAKLQKFREAKGKTQDEVALENNISFSAYAKYETGERVPRDEIKERLAHYYNSSVGFIFFNENVTVSDNS